MHVNYVSGGHHAWLLRKVLGKHVLPLAGAARCSPRLDCELFAFEQHAKRGMLIHASCVLSGDWTVNRIRPFLAKSSEGEFRAGCKSFAN